MNTVVFAAAAAKASPLENQGWLDLSTPQGIVIVVAIGIVLFGLIGWGIFALTRGRGRDRHRHRHHRHHHRKDHEAPNEAREGQGEEQEHEEDEDETTDDGKRSSHSKRRRRRRRREHRPRNPTLAETGGLPPIRTEAPPGP